MARLGAEVFGIDACKESIEAANSITLQAVNRESLKLRFENLSIEDLQESSFEIILASELMEHVNDPQEFLFHCVKLLSPGGMLFLSTINSNWFSKILVVDVAERILRLVPNGTHDPGKFISPQALNTMIQNLKGKYALEDIQGVAYSPLGQWIKIPYVICNYFAIIRNNYK